MRRVQTDGFTLIEIMTALAVLTVALFVLLQAHHGAMQLFHSSREEVMLRDLMSRALGIAEMEVAAGQTTGTGDFGQRFPDYGYRFDATRIAEERPGLVEIQVTVTGPERDLQMTIMTFLPEDQA